MKRFAASGGATGRAKSGASRNVVVPARTAKYVGYKNTKRT